MEIEKEIGKGKRMVVRVFINWQDGKWVISSGGKIEGAFQTMREIDQLLEMTVERAEKALNREIKLLRFIDIDNPATTIF